MQVKPLIWVESVIERHAHSRVEFMIKVCLLQYQTYLNTIVVVSATKYLLFGLRVPNWASACGVPALLILFILEEELGFISIANMLMVQYTSIVFLVGYFGRHQKTNNCLYEMSPYNTK